ETRGRCEHSQRSPGDGRPDSARGVAALHQGAGSDSVHSRGPRGVPATAPGARVMNKTNKPVALTVVPESIPEELKSGARGLAWRYHWDHKEGRWKKMPVNPGDGRPAKTNDAKTWADFGTTLDYYQSGKSDGLGFVLTRDDDIVAIDLDKACATTGEQHEW